MEENAVAPPTVMVDPCTPSMEMQEPNFPVRSASNASSASQGSTRSGDEVLETSRKDYGGFSRSDKKSTTSFNTSLDYTDEESIADDQTNGSLSDSTNQSTFREKLRSFSKSKKHKKEKRNRISQIISGVSYKSKAELFQKLFKNMSGDERLITDYSCALFRDILVHGRLYLSQNWLCFYANIFGWETLVTLQWNEITAITKEKTAKVIPNAIQILTETDKYFFTTFVTREHAYTALFRIWQNALLNHPMGPAELKSVCKKFRHKKPTYNDTIDGELIHDDHDETGDEILEDDDAKSAGSTSGSQDNLDKTDPSIMTENSTAPSENSGLVNPSFTSEPLSESVSSDLPAGQGQDEADANVKPATTSTAAAVENEVDAKPRVRSHGHSKSNGHVKAKQTVKETFKHGFHRPTSPFSKAHDLFVRKKKTRVRTNYPVDHLPIPNQGGETTTDYDSDESVDALEDDDVECPCESHFGNVYGDEKFNFDVDALYEHLFSQESDMMKRVFEKRNFLNWKYLGPLEKQPDHSYKQVLTYTLPLNYSIGPKTSDTVSTQTMVKDNKPGSCYVVNVENTSHGVPYSDSFVVSIRYCITRLSGNRSRMKIHCEIIYLKKVSWLIRNMITKSGYEACKDYFSYLVSVLKSESELVPHNPRPKSKAIQKKTSETARGVEVAKKPRVADDPKVTPNTQSESQTGFFSSIQFSSTSIIAFILIVSLLFLMNIYLLTRVRNLEDSILVRNQRWLPKELPTGKEEWKNLLNYQKGLHELELLKLKEVIGNTATLVKQVQWSISSLHDDLGKNIDVNKLDDGTKEEELPKQDL